MGDEDTDYVCSLDPESVERARVELHEDPADRLAAVKAFRNWIYEQKGWLQSPTGILHVLSPIRFLAFPLGKGRPFRV